MLILPEAFRTWLAFEAARAVVGLAIVAGLAVLLGLAMAARALHRGFAVHAKAATLPPPWPHRPRCRGHLYQRGDRCPRCDGTKDGPAPDGLLARARAKEARDAARAILAPHYAPHDIDHLAVGDPPRMPVAYHDRLPKAGRDALHTLARIAVGIHHEPRPDPPRR